MSLTQLCLIPLNHCGACKLSLMKLVFKLWYKNQLGDWKQDLLFLDMKDAIVGIRQDMKLSCVIFLWIMAQLANCHIWYKNLLGDWKQDLLFIDMKDATVGIGPDVTLSCVIFLWTMEQLANCHSWNLFSKSDIKINGAIENKTFRLLISKMPFRHQAR